MADQDTTLVDTHTFRSPISLERTSGTTPVTDDALSVMRLFFYKNGEGCIEWDVWTDGVAKDDEEPDFFEEIGLWFEYDVKGKRTLTDYDGVFSIPDEALDLLEKHGVDVADMRERVWRRETRDREAVQERTW